MDRPLSGSDEVRDDDPPPSPPVMPDLDACCGQGCDPCIFDLYDAARQRHLAALQAWQARHPCRTPAGQDEPDAAAPPGADG